MSAFVRRFLFDPGEDVLLEIESVNILDLEPPSSISGVGSSHCHIIGEFEDGPFETPIEVFGTTDLTQTFGSIGYTYNGVVGNNASAVSRKADGAVSAEFWNGHALVQLNGKKFRRLSLTRVDTSVGYVELRRLAYVTGIADFRWNLEPGQLLAISLDAAPVVNTTFTATAAIVLGVGGVYPVAPAFAGGEFITFEYDDGTQFTVNFLPADLSLAQVISRVNSFAGFTIADSSGGQLRLTGRRRGTAAYITIVAADSPATLVKLGLPVAGTVTNGTGNVANIDAVSVTEIKTLVEAALGAANVEVEQDSQGRLRISNTATPLTGTIEVDATTTALGLGFVPGVLGDAATGIDGVIPAGTIVQNAGATNKLLTMQAVTIKGSGANSAGPYKVKVRHATDDGTGLAAVAGTITVVAGAPDLGAFSCINPAQITAALTESQIDAQYVLGLARTLNPSSIAREINVIWSARQSNATRKGLRSNALDASANGLFGRMALIRTPMNMLKANALSTVAEPGVGAYRNQRVVYCYPQAQTFVPLISRRGAAGGTGFTDDGLIDVGADGTLASILSQLPPEENPGQETDFTDATVDLESGPNVQGFVEQDYVAFKRSGICAMRMDNGRAIFQSGVTSVDPTINGNLKNISRRRMADYIQDSLAQLAKPYSKKLQTLGRRKALLNDVNSFLEGLRSSRQPSQQRIANFSVSDKDNSAASIAKGLYRIVIKVQLLSSFESIVLATTIGETVVVDELPTAA